MFVSKNKIALAVASASVAGAGSVSAQVNIDATTVTPVSYASEYIASASAPLTLTHPGIVSDYPIGQNVSTLRYVRYDLTNAEIGAGATLAVSSTNTFTCTGTSTTGGGNTCTGGTGAAGTDTMAVAVSSTTTTTIGGVTTALVEGGVGESFAIFSVETDGVTSITTDDLLNVTYDLDVEATSGTIVASVGVFETQTSASNGGDNLGNTSTGTVANFASGLDIDFLNADDATADVTTSFVNFLAGANITGGVTADLGDLTIAAAAGVLNPDGSPVALADIVGDASVTVSGDMSPTNDAGGDLQDTLVTLDGNAADTIAAGSAQYDVVGSALAAAPFEITTDEEVSMLESEYTVLIEFDAANATVDPSDATGAFGSIVRDGTNVDIPYLTTFDSYNQRIILVNRGNEAGDYTITFTTEDGVTATAGSAATGSIPAGETLVLRVTDVVTLSGGTRTAAFISIVASGGNIDVATTQVNLSDSSTDTVVLQ